MRRAGKSKCSSANEAQVLQQGREGPAMEVTAEDAAHHFKNAGAQDAEEMTVEQMRMHEEGVCVKGEWEEMSIAGNEKDTSESASIHSRFIFHCVGKVPRGYDWLHVLRGSSALR